MRGFSPGATATAGRPPAAEMARDGELGRGARLAPPPLPQAKYCSVLALGRPEIAGATMIGRTIGSYAIVDKLGSGGMGEVYLAEHRRIARRAAIKFLLPSLSRDADVVSRFFNEARATSVIKHPGI